MRKKLKIESICLVLLIAIAFSGCGGGGEGTLAENGQGGQEAENNEPGLEDGKGEPEIPEGTGDAEQGEQSVQAGERGLDEALAAFREEMKQNTRMVDGFPMGMVPDESKYPEIDFGKMNEHRPDLDSRELNDVFVAAGEYLQDKYGHEVDCQECFDPRMYDIYGSEDKGVADGYDDEDIFLAEYEDDDGSWMFLMLVRDGKGADWKVAGDGKDYTVPAE